MSDQTIKNLVKAYDNPVWLVKNVLRATPEPYQVDALDSIANNKRTAWRSGHGVGKTTTAAWAILWFFLTRFNSKVITTATSWRQVSKVLWPEIHRWKKQADLSVLGYDDSDIEGLNLMLKMKGYESWFATGESSDVPEKMEGFHAPELFFVIDEGKAVSDKTYESIEGAMTTEGTKQFIISTPPPQMAGYFYDIFSRKKKGYKLLHTSGIDSKRVSREWIESRKVEWGEDSPIYQNRVLGEFAECSDDTLIPLKWIEDAVNRKLPKDGDSVIGVDVARFGDNKSVFIHRIGAVHVKTVQTAKENLMTTSGRVANMLKETKADIAKIDSIGVGAGVVDRLEELGEHVEGVNVGEKAGDTERFVNLRAEMFWGLRKRFESGEISILNDDELIGQLSNIKYKFDSRGRTKIESKEEMQKRGLKSPDKADAFALAFSGVTGIQPEIYIP